MKGLSMKKLLLTFACCLSIGAAALAADDQKADNTGKNTRDRSPEAKTAGDQSESKGDIQISAAIRRAVVKDGSLSMAAHNVKIITVNGETTLRGPVKSKEEKKKLAQYAEQGGASKVINQLEIETR